MPKTPASLNDNVTVIEAKKDSLKHYFLDIWKYRHLLAFFSLNYIQATYRRTLLGWPWMIIRPVFPVLVGTIIFGVLLGAPSNDTPYPLFLLAGQSIWQLFSSPLTLMTRSLSINRRLLTKIYFPRMIVVISTLPKYLVEYGFSLVLFLFVVLYYAIKDGRWYFDFGPGLFICLISLILAVLFSFAIGLWTSVLNSRARDVRFTMPFILQAFSFLTPIIYPFSKVPEKWRVFFLMNPMCSVVESYKSALIGMSDFPLRYLGFSALVIIIFLFLSIRFFIEAEDRLADDL